MPARFVEVMAPSRLHFGLLSFGRGEGRQYGGVGMMTELPGVHVRLTPGSRFSLSGPQQQRVEQLVDGWSDFHGVSRRPRCCLEVVSLPRLHCGLGVGTQLGLAVATALNAAFCLPNRSASQLADSVGRGRRSAVGTYGFLFGGLIAEPGKLANERLAPLQERVALPASWRAVLIEPVGASGVYGSQEETILAELPSVPPRLTESLLSESKQRMLPAAREGDFDGFAESVYRFGRLAGECFAPWQGGPYHGAHLERIVNKLRGHGVQAVGQSSWGPPYLLSLQMRRLLRP